MRELPGLITGRGSGMERQDRDLEASPDRESGDEPADGPAREPGSSDDPGATSQDQPSK
jgi:hypothetical protein